MISAATLISIVYVFAPVHVERWSSDTPLQGEIVSFGQQGIELRTRDDLLPEIIPWFDVQSVEPPDPRLNAFADRATQTWRAHTRRLRGDLAGAMPIYMDIRDVYLWGRGEQSMDVCMGLTQCFLDREMRVEAIEPAIAWFVAAGAHTPGTGASDPSVDAQMLLPVALPPVFRDGDRMTGELPASELLTDRERLLHAYYEMALTEPDDGSDAVEEVERLKRALRARDPGLVLMEQMVYARSHPEAGKRQAARDALERCTRTQSDGWIEVWARLGLGAALLADADSLNHERGVIELIHIVVRLPAVSPGLTLLAAELASAYLESTGRAEWGTRLMHDARTYLMRSAGSPIAQQRNEND